MEITFAEMYSGIAGFRYGLEKANQETGQYLSEQRGSGNDSIRDGNLSDSQTGQEGRNGRITSSSFRCVWANDNDKYACQIYRKHWGDKELIEANIRTIDPNTIPDFDLLTAGFPCPSFSLAGKRKGFQDIRGKLFYEIIRVAGAKRPKVLLLENVKGLLSNDDGKTFGTILEELGNIGYWVEWQTLNSKHFGVPQNRERVFIVGHSREHSTRQIFPITEVSRVPFQKNRSEQTSQKRIRSRPVCLAQTLEASYSKTKSLTNTVSSALSSRYGKDGSENLILQQHSHSGEDGKGRGIRVFENEVPTLTQQMGTGGNNVPMVVADRSRSYADLGRNLESPKPITNALSGVQKDNLVLMDGHPDGRPRNTLRSGRVPELGVANALDCDGYLRTGARPRDELGKPQLLPIGYRRIRRLTPTECERLQGFPDGWTEGVSDTQRYKLLGNAVTTNVIAFLGEKLKGCIE